MAWERRKNYDPLKAAGKKPQNADRGFMSHNEESCFSDTTCSEVEPTTGPSSLIIRENIAEVKPTKGQLLPATRPNRAFALRKKLNSDSEEVKRPSSSVSHDRFNMRSPLVGSPLRSNQPTSLNSTVTKKQMLKKTKSDIPPVRGGGRSTSSLSSKEAEFQVINI